jgi:tRNA-Thr(GGU) m(6)t(6)A37 methyltransferase TsaA
MEKIIYTPIGVIHSPFHDTAGMPIQPTSAHSTRGTVEVTSEFGEGLKDLEGFSHIILIYHFNRAKGYSLLVEPFLDTAVHGVFATRAPNRPNPVGISVVRLLNVEGSTLHIADVDVVDGTPLLDIKPYVPAFDIRDVEKTGWLSETMHNVYNTKSDDRFT